ncbi:MAG: CGNR zinc finger domain-containing protein [Actinobacteria bacterium]|nr:CGNR zinc finger domain-containing protein [Actinomycetota bacterium]
MDYGAYTARTVAEAVDLANLFHRDASVTQEELRSILHRFSLPRAVLDVAAYGVLARRLREVFLAEAEPDRIAALNELIAEYQPEPRIVDHDGQGFHFHFVPECDEDVRCVGASMTMALAHVAVDFGARRFGACAAPDCGNVFVDGTRNRRQRFCSKTCATRVHVAEHRARV